jgi:23S rRNA maturation-related 3'-5' exoribonuclease YhaM
MENKPKEVIPQWILDLQNQTINFAKKHKLKLISNNP